MKQNKTKNAIYYLLPFLFIGCQGEEGVVGPKGENGLNSLVNVTNVSAGDNCENGGFKLEVGIDSNLNGTLDIEEIQTTSYICNGVNGNNSLTSVTTEPAGVNCENGGVKIESGIDSNSDGVLNEIEIISTSYVCNGIDGNNSLIKTTNEPAGSNCEKGGIKIDYGIDKDKNGTLDNNEIITTKYICNGENGNNSLTKITSELDGSICEGGGVKVESGIDSNSNSKLDNNEITSVEYICNGLNGLGYQQTRLLIYHGSTHGSYSSISSASRFKLGKLTRFDKKDWNNAKSIKYNAVARSSRVDNNLILELYNDTDNILIGESKLTSNNLTFETLESNNIIDNLPEKEITLSLYIRSEKEGVSVDFNGKSELIIEK